MSNAISKMKGNFKSHARKLAQMTDKYNRLRTAYDMTMTALKGSDVQKNSYESGVRALEDYMNETHPGWLEDFKLWLNDPQAKEKEKV